MTSHLAQLAQYALMLFCMVIALICAFYVAKIATLAAYDAKRGLQHPDLRAARLTWACALSVIGAIVAIYSFLIGSL